MAQSVQLYQRWVPCTTKVWHGDTGYAKAALLHLLRFIYIRIAFFGEAPVCCVKPASTG